MIRLDSNAVRRTWLFLGAIAFIEATVVLVYRDRFLTTTFRHAGDVPPAGWICAFAVTIATIWYTANALDLWPYLLSFSPFKLLGLAIAVPSSILEETVFRMSVMNLLARVHYGVFMQVALSALAFGLAHAVWAVRGGYRSLVSAVLSTTVLGGLLSIVFLTSGRAVIPCVVAHFLINLVLEPWLGYGYALRMQQRTATA